jgi:hypothetical protein
MYSCGLVLGRKKGVRCSVDNWVVNSQGLASFLLVRPIGDKGSFWTRTLDVVEYREEERIYRAMKRVSTGCGIVEVWPIAMYCRTPNSVCWCVSAAASSLSTVSEPRELVAGARTPPRLGHHLRLLLAAVESRRGMNLVVVS